MQDAFLPYPRKHAAEKLKRFSMIRKHSGLSVTVNHSAHVH